MLQTLSSCDTSEAVEVPFYPEFTPRTLPVNGFYKNDTLIYSLKKYVDPSCEKWVYSFPARNGKWKNPDAAHMIVYPRTHDTLISYLDTSRNKRRYFLNGKKVTYSESLDAQQKCRSIWFEWDETLRLRCMKENLKGREFQFAGLLLAAGDEPAGCGGLMQTRVFLFQLQERHPLFGDTILLSVSCPEFYGNNYFQANQYYTITCTTELDAPLAERYIGGQFDEHDVPTMYSVLIKRVK